MAAAKQLSAVEAIDSIGRSMSLLQYGSAWLIQHARSGTIPYLNKRVA
jgi:hypothetical protein